MVVPSLLLGLGTLLLIALVFLALGEDEPKPDTYQKISSIGGQARHVAHRLSEEYLESVIELLNEKRKPR